VEARKQETENLSSYHVYTDYSSYDRDDNKSDPDAGTLVCWYVGTGLISGFCSATGLPVSTVSNHNILCNYLTQVLF
jgi:hypothetical protein